VLAISQALPDTVLPIIYSESSATIRPTPHILVKRALQTPQPSAYMDISIVQTLRYEFLFPLRQRGARVTVTVPSRQHIVDMRQLMGFVRHVIVVLLRCVFQTEDKICVVPVWFCGVRIHVRGILHAVVVDADKLIVVETQAVYVLVQPGERMQAIQARTLANKAIVRG
jgi:hypothetical protein